jgi:hypothetical protein
MNQAATGTIPERIPCSLPLIYPCEVAPGDSPPRGLNRSMRQNRSTACSPIRRLMSTISLPTGCTMSSAHEPPSTWRWTGPTSMLTSKPHHVGPDFRSPPRHTPGMADCRQGRAETISNLGVVWVGLITADRGERDEVAGHGGVDRERRYRPVAGGQRERPQRKRMLGGDGRSDGRGRKTKVLFALVPTIAEA